MLYAVGFTQWTSVLESEISVFPTSHESISRVRARLLKHIDGHTSPAPQNLPPWRSSQQVIFAVLPLTSAMSCQRQGQAAAQALSAQCCPEPGLDAVGRIMQHQTQHTHTHTKPHTQATDCNTKCQRSAQTGTSTRSPLPKKGLPLHLVFRSCHRAAWWEIQTPQSGQTRVARGFVHRRPHRQGVLVKDSDQFPESVALRMHVLVACQRHDTLNPSGGSRWCKRKLSSFFTVSSDVKKSKNGCTPE